MGLLERVAVVALQVPVSELVLAQAREPVLGGLAQALGVLAQASAALESA